MAASTTSIGTVINGDRRPRVGARSAARSQALLRPLAGDPIALISLRAGWMAAFFIRLGPDQIGHPVWGTGVRSEVRSQVAHQWFHGRQTASIYLFVAPTPLSTTSIETTIERGLGSVF